jgi:hypothetical protein
MRSKPCEAKHRVCSGFARTPVQQAAENLLQALRVLDLVSQPASELTPHPLVIVRAEIENARRCLGLVELRVKERAA